MIFVFVFLSVILTTKEKTWRSLSLEDYGKKRKKMTGRRYIMRKIE